jgi:hypothetical protein
MHLHKNIVYYTIKLIFLFLYSFINLNLSIIFIIFIFLQLNLTYFQLISLESICHNVNPTVLTKTPLI